MIQNEKSSQLHVRRFGGLSQQVKVFIKDMIKKKKKNLKTIQILSVASTLWLHHHYSHSAFLPPNFPFEPESLPSLLLCHGCPFCCSCAFFTMVLCYNLQLLPQSKVKCLLQWKRQTSTSKLQKRSQWSFWIALNLVWPRRLL